MATLGPITRGILVVWVALWIVSFLATLADPAALRLLWLDPRALLEGRLAAVPGVLGHALLHDPQHSLHLLLNGLIFALFAPEAERLWPRRRCLIFLGAAALAGAAATVLLAALAPSGFARPVIGGSGLVSAVIAVHAAVYPDRLLNLILFRCRLIRLFQVLLALDLLGLIATLAGRPDGIAHQVHLAGFASGWLWAGGSWRRGWDGKALLRRFAGRRRARRAAREERAQAGQERELDRILAKIGREGIGSLSEGERRFLEERSRRKG